MDLVQRDAKYYLKELDNLTKYLLISVEQLHSLRSSCVQGNDTDDDNDHCLS